MEGACRPSVDQILIMCKYVDVFSEDLSGLPPSHEIDFMIEFIPETHPISKTSYKMAPVELVELKK